MARRIVLKEMVWQKHTISKSAFFKKPNSEEISSWERDGGGKTHSMMRCVWEIWESDLRAKTYDPQDSSS